jgi:tetratricopeptide (TPR) repeat protein
MQIILRRNLTKRALVAVEAAVFLALALRIAETFVAEVISRKTAVKNLDLAVKLDPSNSDYHLRLGRLYQYSLTDINSDLAVEHFRRATELNPFDPRPWLDLGLTLEFQGKTPEAEACLRRADFLARNIVPYQWSIGNFFLLHGNVDEAFRHFKTVLAGKSGYDYVLFTTAWKASGDAKKILEEVIPNSAPVEFDYLYFLIAQKRHPEAQSVWRRIVGRSEKFSPQRAAAYIDDLIDAHRAQEAYQIWLDLRMKGLIKATYEETHQNPLINGDFEEDLLNMGFDWRIAQVEDANVRLDQTTYHSPGHALLIQFLGKQNVDYHHVYQYVVVEPKCHYRLRGYMKSEGITTDTGPRLEVRDAYDPSALAKSSEGLTGSTTGWVPLILDFATSPKTDLIIVRIARPPSLKLDNLIAGRVWVDDLRLSEVQVEAARAP